MRKIGTRATSARWNLILRYKCCEWARVHFKGSLLILAAVAAMDLAGCSRSSPVQSNVSSASPLSINIGNPLPDSTSACSAPSSARAGEQITVSGGMGKIVIERQPFRLSVLDASGNAVLGEMVNTLSAPSPYLQPAAIPGGSDPGVHQTAYAPLGFVTGGLLGATYPATPWSGNLVLGLTAGIQYTVCRVESAKVTAQGLEMQLSTNDPAGSVFTMTITSAGNAAFRIQAALSSNIGPAIVVDSFQSKSGEAFRGFGGRHNALDQRGHFFYNWIQEENFGAGPLQSTVNAIPDTGGNAYLFPNGPEAAYYAQSLFYSSNGYGFLLNQPELSLWSMASDRDDAWQLAVAANRIDYTVAPGTASQAIAAITQINGRQRVPPPWAVGPEFDRAVVEFGQQLQNYQANVQDDLANIQKYAMPFTAFRLEGWTFLSSTDLANDVKQISALGAHTLFYFRPFISLVNDGFEMSNTASDALSNGYVATLPGGLPYVFGNSFGLPTVLVDFTKPSAQQWWQGRIRQALDLGADGFMQDFGEETQVGMQFASGVSGADYHNSYAVDYGRVTRELFDQYQQSHPDRSLYFFTRSGYSGLPGSTAYENANFPGDELTDYSRSAGLASLTTDMLNRAVGGAYGYTTDIGGYEDLYTSPTTKELLLRWAEWAALSPFFRLHNSGGTGTQMPWDFDQETIDDYRALAQLHQRAASLILKLWAEAQTDGLPPTRPLWLVYPDDSTAASQDQEWLLGPDVLVAPVVIQGATSQQVYLPKGCWTYVPTSAQYSGGASVTVAAPLGTLPYFFHCGTNPF